jgi:hypothetical protein
MLDARDIRRTVPDLRAPDIECADPGLDRPVGSMTMPNHAPPAIRQPPVGEAREERLDFRLQRRGEHSTRPLGRNLRQRIVHRARLAQGDDAGIFSHDISLPSEVLAGLITRLDTPPPRPKSPIFGYSSPQASKPPHQPDRAPTGPRPVTTPLDRMLD